MQVFYPNDPLPVFREPVVTVGSFDGVHLGHSFLLGIMREEAQSSGGETVVVTFAEHPRKVLNAEDEVGLITSLKEKILLLEKERIDNLVVLPFDEELSRLSPEEFLCGFLIGKLGVKQLVVGYNHHFGRGREGDAAMLRGLEEKYGFRIRETPRFDAGGEKISSTAIRKAISEGDLERAKRLLGHPYMIVASVGEHGELMTDDALKLLPPEGRYYIVANGRNGVFSVGPDGAVTLETSTPINPGAELLISF